MNLWQKWTRNEKRIYMIPTRFGAAMCFLFLFFTVTGAHYSNNLIFLFAFILISFLLVAILQTAKNLRGLQILEAQINAGFPEQNTSASLLVFNKRNLDKFGLRIQFRGQKNSVIVDEIFPKDSQWITHPFSLPKKRGRFFTERVQVSTDAPYGLFYGWYYVYRNDSGVVYPSPKGQQFESKTPRSAGADFSGIKEYVEGDPIHRMSWKHSAKRDELLLKEFRDESPTTEIYNIADCPQADIEGKLSQMSLWICEAEKNHKSYGMILGDKKSTIGSGDTHMRNCLHELGVYEA